MSKSSGAPRTQIIALRQLDPPSTLPRGQARRRPSACGCGTVSYAQSTSDSQSSWTRPGIVDRGVVVATAGLEQEDAGAAVHQPARDDGAGRARADDDDIGVVLAHGRLASVMGTTLEPLPVPCHVAPTWIR